MEFNEILELIKTISDSKVTSFTMEEGDKKITIKAGDKAPQTEVQAAAVKSEETSADSNLKHVKSPLVGTFYCAPSPDDEPFVKVGDSVKKGQVIGIIEAMKLMNEIESEYDGIVEEIMVNNGDMVEYGQTIIKIK